MRIIFTLCLWIGITVANGQNNPFDIERKNHNASTLPTEQQAPITAPNAEVLDPQEEIVTPIQEEVSIQEPQKETPTENIFDIGSENHVLSPPTIANDTVVPTTEPNTDNDNPFEITDEEEQKDAVAPTIEEKPQEKKVSKDIIQQNLPVRKDSSRFIFWLSLLSIVIIALITTLYNNTIGKIFRGMTNDNVLSLNQRNEHGGLSISYISLYLISIVEIAIFIYLLYTRYSGNGGWGVFWKVFLMLLGLIFSKHVLIWAIGQIFKLEGLTSFYNFRIQSYQILLGIALIPITLLMHYSPHSIAQLSLYAGILACFMVLGLLYAKSTLSALSVLKSNLFHFLLYLCTFEIIPILILVKLTVM